MRSVLIVCALLGATLLSGQEEKESLLNFDIGYRRAFRIDPYQSDLRQNGHWLSGGGGFTDIHGPWFHNLELAGHAGLASPQVEGSFSIRDFGGECYYELLYSSWKPSWGGTLYLGFSNLTDLAYTQNTNFSNNVWSWRVLSGFGAGAAYLIPFHIKSQSFRFRFQQHIPLMVFGSGPVYTPAIVADEENWREWTVFGGNQIWRSQYELEWRLKNGNAFGIRYIWSYGRLNSPNIQHWAFHHLGLIMHIAL